MSEFYGLLRSRFFTNAFDKISSPGEFDVVAGAALSCVRFTGGHDLLTEKIERCAQRLDGVNTTRLRALLSHIRLDKKRFREGEDEVSERPPSPEERRAGLRELPIG